MPHVSKRIPIITGSRNDASKLQSAVTVLENFGFEPEVLVMSAHRNPHEVAKFARSAKQAGCRVILTAAGMSNALSGTVAAHSRLPVIGIPLSGGAVDGLDSLLSTVQMPPGMPVATFPIDGSANAALDVVRRFAVDDPVLDRKLRGFVERGCNVKAPMPDHTGKVRDTFVFQAEDLGRLRLIYTSDRLRLRPGGADPRQGPGPQSCDRALAGDARVRLDHSERQGARRPGLRTRVGLIATGGLALGGA